MERDVATLELALGAGGEDSEVRAERLRILYALLDGCDALVETAVAAIVAEIPGYGLQGEALIEDLRGQVTAHYRTKLHAMLEDHKVTLADVTFVRGAATRRARAGFALEDYVNAYRVGRQVFWEAALRSAAPTPIGHAAALSLATPLMTYNDFVATHAGHAYVEFQQYVVADADRERRDLLEHLLAGELPGRGPLLAAARSYGIAPGTALMVASAVAVGAGADADTAYAASAVLARAARRETRTLVVVRQGEIVAVPALAPGADPAGMCDRLERIQQDLARDGIPLAMGIGTVAGDVAELPRAYEEARAALGQVGPEGGVTALPRLSPLRYLALHADDTARRLVDPRLHAFVLDDRARGGVLCDTIRAFADADLKLRAAAERLQVHPNTAQYRLRRIHERTGRDPRRFAEISELLIAIALEG